MRPSAPSRSGRNTARAAVAPREALFHGKALRRRAAEPRRPDGDAIAAAALGGVQRFVGGFEKLFPAAASAAERGDTDRAGDLHRAKLAVEFYGFQLAANAFG